MEQALRDSDVELIGKLLRGSHQLTDTLVSMLETGGVIKGGRIEVQLGETMVAVRKDMLLLEEALGMNQAPEVEVLEEV